MICNFKNIVSALCYGIIQEKMPQNIIIFPNNQIVNFVLIQQENMPSLFRIVIIILTFLFNLWSYLKTGKLFEQLNQEQREKIMMSWRNSPLSFCRDLMRFYDSLTIFAWYSTWEKQVYE